MNLELSLGRTGDIPVLAMSGDLDLAVVGQVGQALEPIEASKPPILVLDLRGLTFLDSSGLRLILEADLRARREGRRLALVRGPEPVHRVFRVTTLDTRLEFVDDPNPAQTEPS